jgi:signal transduction histidine kinase
MEAEPPRREDWTRMTDSTAYDGGPLARPVDAAGDVHREPAGYLATAGRGLVLAALAVPGPILCVLQLAMVILGSLGPYPLAVWVTLASRTVPNLGRRLAYAWSGILIPAMYRPRPTPPKPDADGWYRHEDRLYKRPWMIKYREQIDWLAHDDANSEDLGWYLTNIFVGLPLALASVVVTLLAGPRPGAWLQRQHARWTRRKLGQPGCGENEKPLPYPAWAVNQFKAVGFACAQATLAVLMGMLGLLQLVLGALFLLFGLGSLLGAPMVENHRIFVNRCRAFTEKLTGTRIDIPYLPEPAAPAQRPDGMYLAGRQLVASAAPAMRADRWRWVRTDPATWRDLGWMLANVPVAVAVLVPEILATIAFFTLAWPWLWAPVVNLFVPYGPWQSGWNDLVGLLPFLGTWPRVTGLAVGLAAGAGGLALAPWLLATHTKWTRWLLGPTTRAKLAHRVQHLTESRTDAIDTQTAELRRIERDLHDGAQARLVAVGLHLTTLELLIDSDPETAKMLLAKAKDTSSAALRDLRDLVRGINPPVLSERGLTDAVRALALDCPLTTEVSAVGVDRLDPPLEAAGYFAIAELLANAAKHSSATHASIELRRVDDQLRLTIVDNGRGGADPLRGSGIRGIERRLSAFDGTLALTSPVGGPTTVVIAIPLPLNSSAPVLR